MLTQFFRDWQVAMARFSACVAGWNKSLIAKELEIDESEVCRILKDLKLVS